MTVLGSIYKILKKIAEATGFILVIKKKNVKFAGYAPIFSNATYAPWLSDNEFNEIYEIIKDYTLVDQYRCFELWQIIAETAKLNGALIEIGVWRGGSGTLIAKKAKLENIKNNVYLCDTFKGVVKAGTYDSSYKNGEHSDTSIEIVEKLIEQLKLNNIKLLTGIFPEETSQMIADSQFRFCHIDVDVYQSAQDIVGWLWPKLVIGGIIVFDDYGFRGCNGITRFVNEERNKKDRLVIYNLNGHAIIIKISN